MTRTKPVSLRPRAEAALIKAISERIGCDPDLLDSETPGVVAISRLDSRDSSLLDWQEVASVVAREIGVGVVCVANCDWNMVDDCDEEATLIAFDVPDLPEEYRNDYRNQIEAVDPNTAPTAADFRRHRRARQIIASHVNELESAARTRKLAGMSADDLAKRLSAVSQAAASLEVSSSSDVYTAIETLDFDQFIALSPPPETASSAPGM